MTEEWRQIPGWEGYYDVSDQGRIRSWRRRSKSLPYVIGQQVNQRDGYLFVRLYRDNAVTVVTTHKLVMLAFVGPRPEGMEVRHLNSDKADARLVNLKYGTKVENAQDCLAFGNHPQASKTHCPHGHPYDAANTIVSMQANGRNRRACRACSRRRTREYMARQRAARAAA